jgi:excisionase family DNA binding protein
MGSIFSQQTNCRLQGPPVIAKFKIQMNVSLDETDLEKIRKIIQEEIARLQTTKTELKYYSRVEAANLLGVSLPTLHKLVNEKRINRTTVGRRVLFSEEDIKKFTSQS